MSASGPTRAPFPIEQHDFVCSDVLNPKTGQLRDALASCEQVKSKCGASESGDVRNDGPEAGSSSGPSLGRTLFMRQRIGALMVSLIRPANL